MEKIRILKIYEKEENMKEAYHDKQIENYIYERLRTTSIQSVWYPIISEVLLRRRLKFQLTQELLDRDIDSIIENVNTIVIKRMLVNHQGGFFPKRKTIALNRNLFLGEKINCEKIFNVFVHELTHAISFEPVDDKLSKRRKYDRTFPSLEDVGSCEIFTEERAKAVSNSEHENYLTSYIDIIAASIGVKKKDLLIAADKGKSFLENIVNFNGTDILKSFKERIETVYNGQSEPMIVRKRTNKIDSEVKKAHEEIMQQAYNLINARMVEMDSTDIELVKRVFKTIRINQYEVYMAEFRMGIDFFSTPDIGVTVGCKMSVIVQILENEELNDKQKLTLISRIKRMDSINDIYNYMIKNGVKLNYSSNTYLTDEEIERYNTENASIEWDDKEIINYIKEHKQELQMPIRISGFRVIRDRLKNALTRFSGIAMRNENLKLPNRESRKLKSQEDNNSQIRSWDLRNWETNPVNMRNSQQYVVKGNKKAKSPRQREH